MRRPAWLGLGCGLVQKSGTDELKEHFCVESQRERRFFLHCSSIVQIVLRDSLFTLKRFGEQLDPNLKWGNTNQQEGPMRKDQTGCDDWRWWWCCCCWQIKTLTIASVSNSIWLYDIFICMCTKTLIFNMCQVPVFVRKRRPTWPENEEVMLTAETA